jgi:hypothetical protein
MADLLTELRTACAEVARRARQVTVCHEPLDGYAASLPLAPTPDTHDLEAHLLEGSREELAAFWLTLDAINFGSGWFPTLRKRAGRSGYFTIATGIRYRFRARGPWSAQELLAIGADELALVLGQDPAHELMALFAGSLRDLGKHVVHAHNGRFAAVANAAERSAARLVETLADWDCFSDFSIYEDIRVPFLKRAQIVAADLELAGVTRFDDLNRLTMFADNLVPHVLRLDGVLSFAPALRQRIERGELLEHGSPEEVEIRACAVQAIELIVQARGDRTTAAEVDRILWHRGQQPRYKARPRHRSRCTAY